MVIQPFRKVVRSARPQFYHSLIFACSPYLIWQKGVYSHLNLPYTRVMGIDLSFPPGKPLDRPGPIERFMPPLEGGSVTRVLQELGSTENLLVDPFGASPHLVRESALAGGAVLVAANNPVTRFVIHHTAMPISRADLQAALAKFSIAQKDGSRIEPFVLDLYRTLCSRCGEVVSADYFVWDKDREEPILKGYGCPHCSNVIEEPTNEVDRGLAQSHTRRGLQFAMALEQISPSGDQYRRHAEAALNIYTGRALYALITLVSKLEQIEIESKLLPAAQALLLYSFDACNALWAYPEGRYRPRRLSLSPQYVESNVWRAMERAVDVWSSEGPQVQVSRWPEDGLPTSGKIAVYPGSARFLSETLARVVPKWILTALPRPNQPYWTLSALWAAWLWGREAAEPIKVALHRRRYDWFWHARALHAVFSKVRMVLEVGSQAVAFLPEAEPGFVGATLMGLDSAGFEIIGKSFRVVEGQALFQWQVDPLNATKIPEHEVEFIMSNAVKAMIEARGEPTPFVGLHAAALTKLAEERQLGTYWNSDWSNPISVLGGKLESVLYDRGHFLRIGRATEMERGVFWLVDPKNADDPLSDRVEGAVLQILRERNGIQREDLFDEIYETFRGFITPDKRFVENCLQSYAVLDPDDEWWHLREEDRFDARQSDIKEIRDLLMEIGAKMGFNLIEEDEIIWNDKAGDTQFRFRIQETARLGGALLDTEHPPTFVLPGGRAALVMARVRGDPRLSDWLKSGPRIIKFRHIRRLSTETTLTRENLYQRFTIDPPEHHDPQLPLL
jgi:hypothetical protein